MPIRPIHRTFGRQPPYDVPPPFPWVPFDVRHQPSTLVIEGSASRGPGAHGLIGWRGNGSNAGAYKTISIAKTGHTAVDSLAIACMFRSTASTGFFVSLGVSGNSTGGYFFIQPNSSLSGYLMVGIDDAANISAQQHTSTRNYQDGKLHCAVGYSRTDGANHYVRLFVDGEYIAGGFSSGFNATTFDRFAVNMLRRAASAGHAGAGAMTYAAMYAKGLTEFEAQRASATGLWALQRRRRLLASPAPLEGTAMPLFVHHYKQIGIM